MNRSIVLAVAFLGCSGGAPQLSSGLGPIVRSDAGMTADASAPDAGVDGPPRDIEITAWFIGQAGDDGGTRIVLGLPRLSDVRAQWRWRDGGWGLSQATFEDDGGYRIRNVPAGEAIVFFPTFGGLVTTASQLDFSLVAQGRLDVDVANPAIATTLRVDVNNAVPWLAGDSDTLFARETPFALTGQPTLGAGVRNFSSTFRWNQQAYPLMVGSRGDTFSYFQVRQRTGGPIPYRSILAAGTAIAPDMANGTNTSVGVTLTEPPTVGADVRLDFPACERALKEPRPSLPILLSAFTVTYRRGLPRVGVVTQGNRRIEAGLMVVAALGLPPGQPLAEGRFEWADVFPRDELVASVVTRGDVVISNGIATDTFNLFYERSVPLTGNTATLDATLSPVRDLSVGGQRAVAPLRGVGLTPVLSWSPPAQGTPTRYAVTLFDLVDQNYSAAFFTTKTQLELPPFTLTAGRTYVAIVTAERGAYDLLRPTFRPADSERVAAITDSFTP